MDAASALADLTEISSQVEGAVVLDGDGGVVASTSSDAARSRRLAEGALGLLEAAAEELARDGRTLVQLEAALPEASVFVLREGGRTIAATTTRAPTSGLVFYDLKTCLRALAQPEESRAKPRRKRAKRAPATDA